MDDRFFDDTLLDDPDALATLDPVLREIAGWGALVRRAAAAAEPALALLAAGREDRPRAVVAAGADGRLLRAVLEAVCPVPFVAWPHAGLPGWAGPLDLVALLSVTGGAGRGGDVQVRIAAEAVRRGCRLLLVAPEASPVARAGAGRATTILPAGSADPLALAVPLLCALHALGLGPACDAEGVARALDDVAVACGPARPVDDNPAKELALVLAADLPVVWGGSVLAARAARRVAEALRASTGRPALAGDAAQLVPVLQAAPVPDIFADPYDQGPGDGPVDPFGAAAARPVLVVLDDGEGGTEAGRDGTELEQLEASARARGLRVHVVHAPVRGSGAAAGGSSAVARFAALQAIGRYTAAYLSVGLRRAT